MTSERHFVVVPHTHWDREWYRVFEEYRFDLVRLIDALLDLLDRQDDFVAFHLDGQSVVVEDYLEIRPENRERLVEYIGNGRISIGPWYVLPDEFLVSAESLVRNLKEGMRVADLYGGAQMIGYLPDQFGHVSQMPQILVKAGMETGCVWRGVGPTVNDTVFSWVAPDGTRLPTCYLPEGYGNGAWLPDNVPKMKERFRDIEKKQEHLLRVPTVLVMNGTDHLHPVPEVPSLISDALSDIEGWTYEMGTIKRYWDLVKDQIDLDGLNEHHGEFRSPARAALLVGVTSARAPQKVKDFENDRLLTRYVEPIAGLARFRGGLDPTGHMAYMWQLHLRNHPHDSICGCSIDAVHRQMWDRASRVDQLGERLIEESMFTLMGKRISPEAETVKGVWLWPGASSDEPVPVKGTLPVPTKDRPRSMVVEGTEVPVQMDPKFTLFDRKIPTSEALDLIRDFELLGHTINHVASYVLTPGTTPRVEMVLDYHADRNRVDAYRDRVERDVGAADHVHLRIEQAPGIMFIAQKLRQGTMHHASLGYHGEVTAPTKETWRSGPRAIENEHYLVGMNGDGGLDILDKSTGIRYSRVLTLVDEGDRGDEYNFDPVKDSRIDTPSGPVHAEVVEVGPVRSTMRISARYEIPRRIFDRRTNRMSKERMVTKVITIVELWAGVKRVDFNVNFTNNSEDHRLRVHVPIPFKSSTMVGEGHFDIFERRLEEATPGAPELPIGTVPAKSFFGAFGKVEGKKVGAGIMLRGLQEGELVQARDGPELALTLLRSCAWLSRGDLEYRPMGNAGPMLHTKESQELGEHLCEYSFTTGTHPEDLLPRAWNYAYPCRMFPSDSASSEDIQGITFSDARAGMSAQYSQGDDIVIVRLWNPLPTALPGTFAAPPGFANPKKVDILGRDVASGDDIGGMDIALGPKEIATFAFVKSG